MSYSFRNTAKISATQFCEDRGHPHYINDGDADFSTLSAEFADLPVGSSAMHAMDGSGWDIVSGCPWLDAESERAASARRTALQAEIEQLDAYLPRAVEDLIDAGVVQLSSLSAYNQARAARKVEIRAELANI